jgi:hypothetical protein
VYKDDNIFGAITRDKSFILGQNNLTFFLRTKNSLNLHWLLHFQVATPLNKTVKYTTRSNPCGLLEILGEEALTGIKFVFQLNNLAFSFLLVFTLSDSLVC